MPADGLAMRQIKDILRLRHDAGLSFREIARCLNISVGVVSKYLQLATAAGITWPPPDDLDEDAHRPQPIYPRYLYQTSPRFIRSCAAKASLFSFSGKSTPAPIRTSITVIHTSACSIEIGGSDSRRQCDRRTRPATRCSSNIAARPFPYLIH